VDRRVAPLRLAQLGQERADPLQPEAVRRPGAQRLDPLARRLDSEIFAILRAMGFFVTRTYTDGLLDTRGYRLRCFAENLLCAAVAPGVVVLYTFLAGGGTGSVMVGVLAVALVLAVATTVRTTRGAAVGGILVAAALVLFLVVTHWLFSHPILPE
jgi:hypothetical protein